MRIPLILFVFHYFYHYYNVSSIICRLSDQSMDRLICHVIQSCRECTGKRRGMQARRTAEDEAPSSFYWWWCWWGGGRGGRDSMLDIVFINLSEVLPPPLPSVLPYPPFLLLLLLTVFQSRSNDSQINKKPPPMSRRKALTS